MTLPNLHSAVRRPLHIVCYGALADRIGRSRSVEVPFGVADVGGLKKYLAGVFPEAAEDLLNPATRAAIADVIVADGACVADAAQIELLPPVSGG